MDYFNFSYLKDGMFDFKDKARNVKILTNQDLSRTIRMFRYGDLPETVEPDALEMFLQTGGFALWRTYKGDHYVYTGGLGGTPDVYYHPTIATIANPAQPDLPSESRIGVDCVLIKNDSMLMGLLPILYRYNSLIVENELSISTGLILSRLISLITAKDENQKEAVDIYLEKIAGGELSAIFDESFVLDGIKTQPYANSSFNNSNVQLTEIHKYLHGNKWRALGINADYNTKRENISEHEAQVGQSLILTVIEDMLQHRKEGIEEVNKLYGLNVSVELAGAWEEEVEQMKEEVPEETQEEAKGLAGLVKKLTGGGKNEEENNAE